MSPCLDVCNLASQNGLNFTLLVCFYLLQGQAIGTVLIPVWPSAPWWSAVAPLLDLHPFLELGFSTDVLTYPPNVAISAQHLPRGRLLALWFDLSVCLFLTAAYIATNSGVFLESA